MNDLRDLYQEMILDHSKTPHNFGDMDGANAQADGSNPLCGDKISVYLQIEDGIIKDAKFNGCGCAISVASASMMTDAIIGKTESEAEELFGAFHEMATTEEDDFDASSLGKLSSLAGVKDYPMRVKCATLAWHTMDAAIKRANLDVTTE